MKVLRLITTRHHMHMLILNHTASEDSEPHPLGLLLRTDSVDIQLECMQCGTTLKEGEDYDIVPAEEVYNGVEPAAEEVNLYGPEEGHYNSGEEPSWLGDPDAWRNQ